MAIYNIIISVTLIFLVCVCCLCIVRMCMCVWEESEENLWEFVLSYHGSTRSRTLVISLSRKYLNPLSHFFGQVNCFLKL